MSIPIKEPIKDITPAGNHIARCYMILHLGTILDSYKGEEKLLNKVRLTFELSNELKEFREGEGEKPYSISQEYTLSMGEKANLRKLVEGWTGEEIPLEKRKTFEIACMIGKVCLLNVVHRTAKTSGNKYAIISSTSPVPDGMAVPDQINESVVIDYDNITEEIFYSLPEFIRNKMMTSIEYRNKFDIGAQGADPIPGEKTANTSFPPDNSPENPPWK